MTDAPFVSVLMPIRNEERYLGVALDSLLAGVYPAHRIEYLLIDGMSDDGTRGVIADYQKRHDNIRLIDNPRRIVPTGMNLGIKQARGEIIVRTDSHTLYDADYVSACVRLLTTTDAWNVGGKQRAVGTDPISSAIALATSSWLGAGDAKFRVSDQEAWVETVYLGAWRKSTLESLGGFDEEFVINQDYELNHRLRLAGGMILLSPEVKCRYFVRPSFAKLAKQYFRYGVGRVQTIRKHPDSLRLRQLAAPLLVVGLGLALLLGMVHSSAWFLIVFGYLSLVVGGSIQIGIGDGNKGNSASVALALMIVHLCWGAGFLVGGVRASLRLSQSFLAR